MAWREGTDLHIENLSTLMVVDPAEIISEWEEEIERAKRYEHPDFDHMCLFGTVTSLFDTVYIHSGEWDNTGLKFIADHITEIDTERQERIPNPL